MSFGEARCKLVKIGFVSCGEVTQVTDFYARCGEVLQVPQWAQVVKD